MSNFLTFIFSCLLGACPAADQTNAAAMDNAPQTMASIELASGEPAPAFQYAFSKPTISGNYLASQFAQRHHDWGNAVTFIEPLLEDAPEDAKLINKAMVLAMGSGEYKKALGFAKQLITHEGEEGNTLALLFIALNHFKDKNYQEAATFIKNMPEGSLSDFIFPLLGSWSQAALGNHDTKALDSNTIHIHHAILIAEFLGETAHVEDLLQKSLGASGLSLQDLERIADTYAHIGQNDIALELYMKLSEQWPENRPLAQKLVNIKNGAGVSYMKNVAGPEEGIAEALYDTAKILFQEQSDESARVFAHMALMLNPKKTDAKLLLGYVTARHDQYAEAIGYYQNIAQDDAQYSEARRMAADLLESQGRIDDALRILDELVEQQDDLEALIQIGDIHRRAENFKEAVHTYNKAAKRLGRDIPHEYWQLHYVRGMSYERLGQWDKAEADLSKALEYQPDNPLIMNYLGYAWADQGLHLDKALELVRKAAALQPSDGYIIDSLGWVLFKMNRFEEAVPHLEQAVKLLPYDPVINDHLGDAYWKVGRTLEARFQWARAQNHSEDKALVAALQNKLDGGLPETLSVADAKARDDNS